MPEGGAEIKVKDKQGLWPWLIPLPIEPPTTVQWPPPSQQQGVQGAIKWLPGVFFEDEQSTPTSF